MIQFTRCEVVIGKILKRVASLFGYRLRRIKYPHADLSVVQKEELAELDRCIQDFVRSHPDFGHWSNERNVRKYLTKSRVAFYLMVVGACQEFGIDFSGKRIAEIGTGPGYLLRVIKRIAPDSNVIGYEPWPAFFAMTRIICPHAELSTLPLEEIEGEQFDVVFCLEVLEHLERPDLALRKLVSLLGAEGALIVTVPDGREDQYEKHLNFWSSKSWSVFINTTLDEQFCSSSGQYRTGHNYAVVRRIATEGSCTKGMRSGNR